MSTAARICDSCGATGQTGAFCDECGQTLPDIPAPAPEPARAPEPTPVPERVSAPEPVNVPEPASATEPVSAPEPVSTTEPVSASATAPGSGSASALVVPVAEPAQPFAPFAPPETAPPAQSAAFPPAEGKPAPAGGKIWTWDMLLNATSGGSASTRADPLVPPPAPVPRPPAPVPRPPAPVPRPAPEVPPPAPDVSATLPIAPPANVNVNANANEKARALIVPVNHPSSAAPKAGTRAPPLPGRPEPVMPSTVRAAPETEEVVGGRSCPWCATANEADRHFCRRCAMSMDPAQASSPVYRSWWRRLFGWSVSEMPYAGERPQLRRDPGRLWRWAAGLAALGVVIGVIAAWGDDAVAAVQDHFASAVITYPNTVTASSSDRAHPVAKIHDGYNNTWWGVADQGVGTHVDATFGQPTDLLDVVITPGAGITQNAFTSQLSPQTIAVTTTSADGSTASTTLSLPDSPGARAFPLRGNDITKVSFTIESSYTGAAPKPEVAITEIEFFEKS